MNARFVQSVGHLDERPQPSLPEFAFTGRSNCGKSSLINYFLGRKRLAPTSGRPGRTRRLYYYAIDDRLYVVDLPGYGFARVPHEQRLAWSRLVRAYLAAGDRPLAAFHLLDVRHRPTAEDVEMSLWLRQAAVPIGIAVTKIDTESRSRLAGRYREIIEVLDLPPETPFFPTSARLGEGRRQMWGWVDAVLETATGND
jgi:GTP-binding protein